MHRPKHPCRSRHMKSLRMSASSSRRRLMTAGFMRLPAWPSMPALPALRSYARTIASAAPASFSGVLHAVHANFSASALLHH